MHIDTVDILLATYNGSKFIREQIDSILNQTYQNIHIIIRDDKSSDNTLAILNEYAKKNPSKITLLISDTQLGVKGNFSELMRHAKAPYIMFSDQDDIWNLDKIEITLNKMKEAEKTFSQGSPILVHTDLIVVDEKLNVINPSFWNYAGLYPKRFHALNFILTQNIVTGCTMMINRSLLKFAHPIPNEAVMHDFWLALVATSLGHVIALPESTMKYRQHTENTLGAKKFWSIETIWKSLRVQPLQDKRKLSQAYELLHRFPHLLSDSEVETINAFIASESASYIGRGLLITKYKLYKNGFLRNLVHIFWPRKL